MIDATTDPPSGLGRMDPEPPVDPPVTVADLVERAGATEREPIGRELVEPELIERETFERDSVVDGPGQERYGPDDLDGPAGTRDRDAADRFEDGPAPEQLDLTESPDMTASPDVGVSSDAGVPEVARVAGVPAAEVISTGADRSTPAAPAPAPAPSVPSPRRATPPPSLPQCIAEPLTDQGRALLRRDLALDAVEVLRQAVARGEPSAPDVLADAYLDSGSFHSAAEWLGLLVERGYVRFAGRLGIALAEIGDHDRAEDALRLAIGSGELAAANDLATLLRDMGRDAEAVQVLTRAADAGDGQAADNLVSFLLDADELAPAIQVAERYFDRSRPDTVVALADARSAARRDEEAEDLYRLADTLGALRAHTAYATFLVAARADRFHAEQQLREARRHREPGSAAALGLFLVEDGRVAEGRDHLVVGATAGDRAAAAALAELDGEDPDDD